MKKILFFSFLTIALIACASKQNKNTTSSAKVVPVANKKVDHDGLSRAVFAGGCFWCTEAVFERVKGVKDVVSGYTGGSKKDADYKKVSSGMTSHAEAVIVYFDPNEVSYSQLLEVFFATHDPTQLNRQGPDVGPQYRSGVFYASKEQKMQAEKYIAKLTASGKYQQAIVTEVTKLDAFYNAEDYHQNYYELHPNQSYVYNVSRPKVEKFKKMFKELVKEKYK